MLLRSLIFLFLFGNLSPLMAQDDSEENVAAKEPKESEIKDEIKFLEFQTNFIDAVKYRATENYDRALSSLEKCETIYPENVAMIFEKAKNYYSLNKLMEADGAINKALSIEPQNFWLRSLKRDILIKLNNLPDALIIQKGLYAEKLDEAGTLLNLYYRMQDVENGKLLLKEVENKIIYVENLQFYKNQFLKEVKSSEANETIEATYTIKTETTTKKEDNLNGILTQLKSLENQKNFATLNTESQKAIEQFSTNALIYWYNGKSLVELKKYNEAVGVLENGLDFIIDDPALTIKFYNELIAAYNALGNSTKSNKYKQMVQKLSK